MRHVADAQKIREFMRVLSLETSIDARVYFTGGATAVLLGWRSNTIDIDVKIVPDDDRIFRAIPLIKDVLQINLDGRLSSPIDFIPVRPDWEERSLFIAQEGKLTFRHFDLDAQALAKVERSHTQDLEDIDEMIRRQLIDPQVAVEYFNAIEPELYRYPAVDPRSFRLAVEKIFERQV